MSTRAQTFRAQVHSRTALTDHLVRLVLGGEGLVGFSSTGIPDEWVGLVVPGQFQSRYYTVRSWEPGTASSGARLTLDVVLHHQGLVTEWAAGDCVGDTVVVTEPQGSFAMPDDAAWLMLVGDLTALPAIARIAETVDVPAQAWVEVPGDVRAYLPGVEVSWLEQPGDGRSRLAEVVGDLAWPTGHGYFWMAGESAQMRAIRKHLMRERRLPGARFDVMGYWRAVAGRQPRAVDPVREGAPR